MSAPEAIPDDEVSLLQSLMHVQSEEGGHGAHISGKEGLKQVSTKQDVKQVFHSSSASEQRKAQHHNIFHRGAYKSHQVLSWLRFDTFARIAPAIFIGLCVLELALFMGRNPHSKSKMISNPWRERYILFLSLMIAGTILAYAFWLTSLTYRVEFIHIPKNAGTSVEVAGADGGIFWGQKMMLISTKMVMPDGHSLCSKYHVPHFISKAIPYKDLTTVCITRHPFSRMVSEYEYLLDARNQIEEVGHAWGHRYDELYGLDLYKYEPCSRMGLNHFTQTVLKKVKSGKHYLNDCHHIPQVRYIWDPSGEQQCNNIIRISDLPGAFNAVMEREGYGVRMSEEVSNAAKRCPGLSTTMLDNLSLQMLADVYADDLKFLNYSATEY